MSLCFDLDWNRRLWRFYRPRHPLVKWALFLGPLGIYRGPLALYRGRP